MREDSGSLATDLTITLTSEGEWRVLLVQGELDLYSNGALLDQVHAVTAGGAKIALDLAGVTFVDSSGLGSLVGALKHVRERGAELVLVAPADAPITRMLTLTGLDQILKPLPDRDGLGAEG